MTAFSPVYSEVPDGISQLFTKYFTHKSADPLHLLEGIKQMTDAAVWDFGTAASSIWKWVCWDESKRRLKTVKSGWKSIVASSVCSTLCNTIVMQSITHLFSANHHLFLIKSESGRCPRSPRDRGWTVRNTGRVTSPSQGTQTIHVYTQW